MSHKELSIGEIHIIHNAVYATRAAMEAATYSSQDIGRVVKQTDENAYWIVISTTPPFAKVSSAYGEITNTTDATITTIWSFTLPDESAISISARVTAKQDTTAERCFYWISGLFYRNGGNATQQGSTANIITAIESDATPTVEFAVSGNEVLLRWTGVASENWGVIPRVEFDLNI